MGEKLTARQRRRFVRGIRSARSRGKPKWPFRKETADAHRDARTHALIAPPPLL